MSVIRDKNREGLIAHIQQYTPENVQMLLGDWHSERLQWRFPNMAPQKTWLCGVGGDRINQLLWRLHNNENIGYSQNGDIARCFQRIGILIGSNNIRRNRMKPKEITSLVVSVKTIRDVAKLRWPEAEVVVFPIPPIPTRGVSERDPMNVEEYNMALKEAGLRSGLSEWEDMDLENDFEDHVHLSESGYLKLLKMIQREGMEN